MSTNVRKEIYINKPDPTNLTGTGVILSVIKPIEGSISAAGSPSGIFRFKTTTNTNHWLDLYKLHLGALVTTAITAGAGDVSHALLHAWSRANFYVNGELFHFSKHFVNDTLVTRALTQGVSKNKSYGQRYIKPLKGTGSAATRVSYQTETFDGLYMREEGHFLPPGNELIIELIAVEGDNGFATSCIGDGTATVGTTKFDNIELHCEFVIRDDPPPNEYDLKFVCPESHRKNCTTASFNDSVIGKDKLVRVATNLVSTTIGTANSINSGNNFRWGTTHKNELIASGQALLTGQYTIGNQLQPQKPFATTTLGAGFEPAGGPFTLDDPLNRSYENMYRQFLDNTNIILKEDLPTYEEWIGMGPILTVPVIKSYVERTPSIEVELTFTANPIAHVYNTLYYDRGLVFNYESGVLTKMVISK